MTEKFVKLVAVGDIFLGEHPVTLGHGVTTMARRHGCGFLFEHVTQYFSGADIVCGNLEGIISPKKENETGIQKEVFWGEPACAQAMKEAGINCLFLANNHAVQHGKDALVRTCALLDEHKIKWTGYNSVDPCYPDPIFFYVQGCTVAMLAYCETQQYHLDTPLLPIIDFDKIKENIDKIKSQADIVIISLHWGDEFINYPSPDQVELGHAIIDAGANVILGHHSHSMQGVEHYKHGLIAYSLGSFIKDLWPRKLRESTILQCEVSPTEVKKVNLVPILLHKKKHRPKLYQGVAGEQYLAHVHKLTNKIIDEDGQDKNILKKRYEQDVQRLLFRDRISTVLHYMRNIHRYDKGLLYENVKLMAKRRLNKKNF